MPDPLEFKTDFPAAAARWADFAARRNTGPMVAAEIVRPGAVPVDPPDYGSGAVGDLGPTLDQIERWAESHRFLGDAIPFYYLEFGADHFSALIGAEFVCNNGVWWALPCVQDLDRDEIRFDRSGRWWQRTAEFAAAVRQRFDGRILIASPSLVSNLDALSAVYGGENLLMAMVDNPAGVHRMLRQIDRACGEVIDAFAEMLDYPRFGSINRHGMYSPGRTNVLQCDFAYMIGTPMYREFVAPYVTREVGRLDLSEYHLDGPGNVRHMEALCDIADLDVVQWVAGDGSAARQDWNWLFDRIDALGKGQIFWKTPAQVRDLWRRLKSRTIAFRLPGRTTQAEYEDLMADLARMTDKGDGPAA